MCGRGVSLNLLIMEVWTMLLFGHNACVECEYRNTIPNSLQAEARAYRWRLGSGLHSGRQQDIAMTES